jgi:hypothetical protein
MNLALARMKKSLSKKDICGPYIKGYGRVKGSQRDGLRASGPTESPVAAKKARGRLKRVVVLNVENYDSGSSALSGWSGCLTQRIQITK